MKLRVALAALALSFLAHAQPAEQSSTHGIAVANMDPSIKPGDNFYLYANGGWMKRTAIPPDRGWTDLFQTLADLSDKRTLAIIEEAGKANAPRGFECTENCRSVSLVYGRGRHRVPRPDAN